VTATWTEAGLVRPPRWLDRFKRFRVVAWDDEGFFQVVERCWTGMGANSAAASFTQISRRGRQLWEPYGPGELRYRAESVPR
jgi:hypothetical protein